MYSKNQNSSNNLTNTSIIFNKRTVVELGENQMSNVNGGCITYPAMTYETLLPQMPETFTGN
jgi:hypothetical protein